MWRPRWPCASQCRVRCWSLTARQRAVLVLRVFDDLSEAQVAQVLDCAVGTVKSTLAHAMARLRDDPRLAGLMDRETL